jgi:RNA polymerase sigma-70 factor (ECF subfamily)
MYEEMGPVCLIGPIMAHRRMDVQSGFAILTIDISGDAGQNPERRRFVTDQRTSRHGRASSKGEAGAHPGWQEGTGIMDEGQLLARCHAGDELAWEALIRRHQARVLSIALTYVGDVEEAKDVAQETFIRVWRRLETCRDPGRFQAWLVQVARSAALDHLRRRKARPPARDLPADEVTWLADPAPDPARSWEAAGRRRLIWRALGRLSEINREMILLKDMQGLPLEEIAGMLELPLGTVKSRTNRARLELARAVLVLEGQAQA